MTELFKAFSVLLSYPSAEMREALPEIASIVENSPLIAPPERRGLLQLVAELGEGTVLNAEERYVDLFDRGRALSLNLFEHLHGESRDRGTAMVDLKQHYAAAGFDLATRELPDYLPVVLEFLSVSELGEARDMLADCAHIMQRIAKSLIARQSGYAAVLQALIVIAGAEPVESTGVEPAREPVEALDRDWVEQPAFSKPGETAPPHAGTPNS